MPSKKGSKKNTKSEAEKEELKKILIKNIDSLNEPLSKAKIQKMSLKKLRSYFIIKIERSVELNKMFLGKKQKVKKSKSKSKSKSIKNKPLKSKSPKTKSQKKRKPSSSEKQKKKKSKKDPFIEQDGLLYNEDEDYFAIVTNAKKPIKFSSIKTNFKKKNISGLDASIVELNSLPLVAGLDVDNTGIAALDDLYIIAYPETNSTKIIKTSDIMYAIFENSDQIKKALVQLAKDLGFKLEMKSIVIKGFKLEETNQGTIARLLFDAKSK